MMDGFYSNSRLYENMEYHVVLYCVILLVLYVALYYNMFRFTILCYVVYHVVLYLQYEIC